MSTGQVQPGTHKHDYRRCLDYSWEPGRSCTAAEVKATDADIKDAGKVFRHEAAQHQPAVD